MDSVTFALFLAGIGLLLVGAEGLVRGASRLAVTAGVSPLVVGLTVVAFGTSAPELAVSVSSAVAGDADIGVGNVVGSNVFNILLILGLAATIGPLVVAQQIVRIEVPILIVVSLAFYALAGNGNISTLEGCMLVAGIVAYTIWAIGRSRKETREVRAEYDAEFSAHEHSRGGLLKDVALVVGGLGMLVLGSEWFVNGAVELAEAFGVSELVIGLTVVALGTSMPEIVTSVLASIRGERDIAVGNVIGSNLFNLLMVMGLTSVVADGGITVADAALRFDIPVMIAVAIACLPVFWRGYVISRWEGILFLLYCAAYLTYLLLDSTDHDSTDAFRTAMLGFVIPLTVVTFAVLVYRTWRNGNGNRAGAAA